MKNKKVGILIGSIAAIILVVFGFTFLINGENRNKSIRYENRFEIYLVKNAGTQAATETDIKDLELQDTPIITEKDFKSYNWFNHSLEISEEVYDRIPKVNVSGVPFVVVADGERIYLGAFWTMLSSLSTSLPVIEVDMPGWPFTIEPGYPWDHEYSDDPRYDKRIYKSLNEMGKLSSDIQKHLTGEKEGALGVIREYFDAFSREDYKTMMGLATESHNKTFVHDGNVWGMKWTVVREIELLKPSKGKDDDSTLIFLVTVEMKTVETSSQYPETEGAFCITLRKGEDGIWRVDEYNNG